MSNVLTRVVKIPGSSAERQPPEPASRPPELETRNSQVARWAVALLALAACLGVAGGTWDAAWHLTLRRESFWSPPHLLLYAGTALALGAGVLGAWSAQLLRVASSKLREETGRERETRNTKPARLGFLTVAAGALTVIGSAPLDELWHRTWGPDVDVWSFPHLVALAGGAAINVGALTAIQYVLGTSARLGLELEGQLSFRIPSWQRALPNLMALRILQVLFLTALLWVAMFSLNWYTLVLARVRDTLQYPALASLLATPVLILAARLLGPCRAAKENVVPAERPPGARAFGFTRLGLGGAALVAGLYMAYAWGAHAFFPAFGYASPPFPPIILAPALAVEAVFLLRQRAHWATAAAAGALFAPVFLLAEAASLAWYPHVPLPPAQTELARAYFAMALERPWDLEHVLLGMPLALAAGVMGGLVGWRLARAVLAQPSR